MLNEFTISLWVTTIISFIAAIVFAVIGIEPIVNFEILNPMILALSIAMTGCDVQLKRRC